MREPLPEELVPGGRALLLPVPSYGADAPGFQNGFLEFLLLWRLLLVSVCRDRAV